MLGGMSRVRESGRRRPVYGGVLRERPLGELPAADLNGNGDDDDPLPVVVARASDGWIAAGRHRRRRILGR